MVTAAAILDRIDARIALVLYLLLLLAAAAPVVLGWLALLPDELEPFAVRGEVASAKPRDYVAVFFLVNISISVLLRIPGIDSVSLTSYFSKFNWPEWAGHALMITFIWFGFVPGLAAAYSAVRANPLRMHLLIGGTLALGLWLAGPWLLDSMFGS